MTTDSNITQGARVLLTAGLLASLVACGGGNNYDSTSDLVVARGVITQLGSIWVNGVEYETPKGGSYADDDSASDTANYKIGQMVRLRGRRNDDGVSGTASEVNYEAEIEGSALGGAINGVTILITPNTNTSEILGFSGSLANGLRYEVSGIWIDDTTLEATFIKIDDDGDGVDEIKGFVEAVNFGVSLTLRGVTYSYGGPTVVAIGDFVEIHFNATTASRVELEDDFNDRSEGQEVEFEGAVNMDAADLANCPAGADFLIDMNCIDWDSVPSNGWKDGLTGPDDMTAGLRVEAEGHFNAGGLLIAEKIKGRGNRVRISSIAGTVNTVQGSFKLIEGNIDVTTMAGMTEYKDGLTINNIDTQVVEVRGVRTGPRGMLAISIKSTGLSGSGSRHSLRAQIDNDGVNSGAGTVRVMGVVSLVLPGTELELNDAVFSGGIAAFLGLIDDDGIVNTNNSPNDVIKVDFDISSGNGSGDPYDAHQIEIEEEDD